MSTKRYIFTRPAAALLVLFLAGCGGSGDSTGMAATNTATGANGGTGASDAGGPQTTAGAFLQQVIALIGETSETAEPIPVTGIAPEPESDADPSPLS